MDEETPTPKKIIQLTQEEWKALHRMLQWPEDLATYDQSNKPINMAEILGGLTSL